MIYTMAFLALISLKKESALMAHINCVSLLYFRPPQVETTLLTISTCQFGVFTSNKGTDDEISKISKLQCTNDHLRKADLNKTGFIHHKSPKNKTET